MCRWPAGGDQCWTVRQSMRTRGRASASANSRTLGRPLCPLPVDRKWKNNVTTPPIASCGQDQAVARTAGTARQPRAGYIQAGRPAPVLEQLPDDPVDRRSAAAVIAPQPQVEPGFIDVADGRIAHPRDKNTAGTIRAMVLIGIMGAAARLPCRTRWLQRPLPSRRRSAPMVGPPAKCRLLLRARGSGANAQR